MMKKKTTKKKNGMRSIHIFVKLAPEPGAIWDIRFFATHKEAEDYSRVRHSTVAGYDSTDSIIGELEVSEREASTLLSRSRLGS